MKYISFIIAIWLIGLTGIAYSEFPWELVAKKNDQQVFLPENSGETQKYSISERSIIISTEIIKHRDIPPVIDVSKWNNQNWEFIKRSETKATESETYEINIKGLEKGFYKFEFQSESADSVLDSEFYFIINSDWKKELMGICQDSKKEIETRPDAYDIGSSIVISNYNNLQEIVAVSEHLSGEILSCLARAFQSKEQFEHGELPDFSSGLNKLRFKRFKGAAFADFVINIPESYNPEKKWPLYIHVDPTHFAAGKYGVPGQFFHDGMIDMWWHTTYSEDMRWKDYVFIKEILNKKFNIDENRIYLYGWCGDGIAAMALALNHPDQWAECYFSTGNSYRHLAGNAINLSIVYDNVHPDIEELVAYMDFAMKCFEYYRCNKLTYTLDKNLSDQHGAVIPSTIREENPSHISYTIESLVDSDSYWLQIDGRIDEHFVASIDAIVDGQSVKITRKNVDAYQLDLESAPLDCTKKMIIIDNGRTINIDPQEVYQYRSTKYDNAKYIKNSRIHGPIKDAFTDAYTVLYTIGKNADENTLIEEIAKNIAVTGPCLPEEEISEELIQNCNLVIVGRADTCEILKKISGELPIQFENNKIDFDGESINEDMGVIMVYPNPLNPDKYISFIFGNSQPVLNNIHSVWENQVQSAEVDVAIFEVTGEDQYNIIRFERFNTIWKWHKKWSESLANVSDNHPRWRWRQWLSHVIRVQMKADVMISEEAFETENNLNFQTITPRKLNRSLKNQWIVKINLKGSELKKLLMQTASGEFMASNQTENESDRAKNLVVDGVTLVKSITKDDSICISDIEPEQYYSVVMPYKLVNGSRLGTTLNDYDIIGDGFLLPILFEYLENRTSLELDDELKRTKLVIL